MEKWQLQSRTVPDTWEELLKILLKNRGIKTQDQADFLHPTSPINVQASDLGFSSAPSHKIIERLKQAQAKQEKVAIFGDYDSDGVCASAVLWEGLDFLGIKSKPFIPNRQKHGYGLSVKALKDLFKEQGKPDLLITVDNGIVALPALEFLAQEGIETIVTDHHQASEEKLPVLALYHSTQVCGTAVAWFLVKDLFRAFQVGEAGQTKLTELLSLVAIATVTDLMPLLGISRNLVAHGLRALTQTQRPGLLALCQLAGVKTSDLTAYHLGYVIGPRINAMGRLADSIEALRLLCTKNIDQAKKLANLLQDTNTDRQNLTKDSIAQAKESLLDLNEKEDILIVEGDYHEGVIGLLAGHLVETYLKPAIVLAVNPGANEQVVVKASARSLAGFNMTKFLRQVEDELINVGGHPMAAGFSVSLKNLPSVKKRLLLLAKEQLQGVALEPLLEADCQLSDNLITLTVAENLAILEPHGSANPRPNFYVKNWQLRNLRSFGSEQNHLRLYFKVANQEEEQIVLAWRGVEKWPDLQLNQDYELLIKIEANSWQNQSRLQLVLQAIRLATAN